MHICEVCFTAIEAHDERCEEGCLHWPPLCCEGCPCGSFKAAYHEPAEVE